MSLLDDNQNPPPDPAPEQTEAPQPIVSAGEASADATPGDPPSYVAPASVPITPSPPQRVYPEDLQISWGWLHFIVSILYAFGSLFFIQGGLAIYYLPKQKLSQQQIEQYLLSKPQFVIGSLLIWYAAVFFFLYITLSLLRGQPFWRSLGWRSIKPQASGRRRNPLLFVFSGCLLSIFVAIATSRMKAPENLPVEEFFKHRESALLFMAMAVLVAPLVEETLFRGYLYPLFARTFGGFFGIMLTGVLFGLMHGYQLGWTPTLVAVLITVGIVFTLVRARTGSVLASYLMHLGYNSFIAIITVAATHGFTEMPKT
jgi:membrane protease YdiL (CAAX protease family)